MKPFHDDVQVTGWVKVTALDDKGQILDVREDHNIFVDQGRTWLAALVSGDAVFGHSHPQVVAFMGYGKGGIKQDVQAERTAGTENSGVTTLETIVPLNVSLDELAGVGHTILVPATRVRFTRVITKPEITYAGGPNSVPLSECGLFITARSNFVSFPAPDKALATEVLVAYHQFRTLTKTADISIQFDWELRF